MRRLLMGLAGLGAALAVALWVSPWPGVLLIRAVFDHGAATAAARLEKHLPAAITSTTLRYDPADAHALLDIYRPPDLPPVAPTVIWVHGGGFVSGRREDVANYLQILAAQGFGVVNVNYTIAPEARYPTPVRQLQAALAFLTAQGAAHGIDPGRLVLAGDSAGAQIAAQAAAVIVNPAYAAQTGVMPGAAPTQIIGTLLFCGVYDLGALGQGGSILGWFVKTTGWAYSGRRDWRGDAGFATVSILPHLTPAFPPAFVSAGNADPLGPQSVALAQAMQAQGVAVETLFFPPDHQPPLGHEYQFDLDGAAGQTALARASAWLRGL